MLPGLIIVIILPIIIGVVAVSPFEPPEIEDEQIQEIPADENPESTMGIILIFLAIVWIFFFARMLRVLYITRYKSRIRK
jgi:ABC-type dipeptide/oligopeptide/nickel transport system permease subunit